MSTMGTFDAFTTARLGIYAAQHGLRVTGNNVSNINTAGYTRQRLDQVSFKAGAYDMYRSQLDNHVGSGALVMNINQVRDPYLDVRFRNTNADVGYSDRMLAGLQNIADILDEVGLGEDASSNEKGDGVLHAQIQKLSEALRAFEKEPTKLNDILVRNAAENLCTIFNQYSDALERLYNETVVDFNDQVTAVNECLTNIRDLNREIRDCEIYGDNALELRDERNRQIDELSKYIHIKVVYSEENIGSGRTVEKLSIFLDNDNPDALMHTDESMLVDGIFGAQLYQPKTMPVLNPNFAKDGYLYLTDVEVEDPDNPGQMITVEQGTNDPTKAKTTRDNDYFGLQITKLYDQNNEEWKKVTVERTEAKDGTPPVKGVYTVDLTGSTGWENGDEFVIGDKTVKIGSGTISADDANDPEKMAAFLAAQLSAGNKDYKITANGAQLVFTARKAGANTAGGQGPEMPSVPTFVPGTPPNNGTLTFGAVVGTSTAGADAVPPTPHDPNPVIDDNKTTQYTYELKNNVWYEVATTTEHTQEVALDDNDLYGSIQATRELLTEAGEFTTNDTVQNIDEDALGKRGIRYYQYSLDLLAKEFAKQYNQMNVGHAVDENGNYIKQTGVDADGNAVYEQLPIAKVTYYEDLKGNYLGLNAPLTGVEGTDYRKVEDVALNLYITDNAKKAFDDYYKDAANGGYKGLSDYLDQNGEKMGGVLFSNRNDNNDPENINAGNISIAKDWASGAVQLVPKYEILFGGSLDHTTQNNNARLMVNMIEKGLSYNPKNIIGDAAGAELFNGNFNDMFSNINSTLGKDIRQHTIGLNTSYTSLVEIDTQRDGVSGVDLNDEAMNMMQFQKAMNAAMRVMTTIDEALDRLINNTGVAGR